MEKIKAFFTNKSNWGYILSCILLFVIIFFWRSNDDTKRQLKEIEKTEKIKEKTLDSLKLENKDIKAERDKAEEAIKGQKTIIINIQDKYNEKINTTSNYTANEHFVVFSGWVKQLPKVTK